MLFEDPCDEQQLCDVLKAFLQEWGPEHIVIAVPNTWSEFWERSSLGRVRLEFSTLNSISIKVQYDLGQVVYTVELAA